jgi:ElaB/YqjD/DUF883 family membrane-anchored ribosome-binding protein
MEAVMEETKGSNGPGGGSAEAESSTDDRFGRAKEFVNDKYSAASDAVKDGYSRVRDRVGEVDYEAVTDQVRSYVRSNPGKALLISVGVGFLVGLLLRRAGDED